MEFIIGWSFGGILLCVIFYVATVFHQRYVKQQEARKAEREAEDRRYKEQRQQEFLKLITYNREHMPSLELPPLAPDWAVADGFITETRFGFADKGDRFEYYILADNSYKTKYILKSNFDSDTLRLIELLNKDVGWFYDNTTGATLTEESETLENFLRGKYSGLLEESISQISRIYCKDNR